MPRVTPAAIALIAAVSIASPTHAYPGEDLAGGGCSGTSGDDGGYGVGCNSPGSEHVRTGVACNWTRIDAASYFIVGSLIFGADFDPDRLFAGANGQLMRIDGEAVESAAWYVQCPGDDGHLRWIPTSISVRDVIDAAAGAASDSIDRPISLIDPDPTAGGVVNLGMWLAVEPQSADPVHAEAGPYWADVIPVHESTTFDFDNGESVTCAGTGTPISDLGDPGEGPCGYTYTQPSSGSGYTITITTTWNLNYVSNAGSGTLSPPITRSTSFTYDVDEVQTIGRDG
jgi:hypothetical protein